MTKIVVSTPFYLGKEAGKPVFYPVGRGDAPESDLESPFGLALEKGGYFTRVAVSEVATTPADTPAQDGAVGAAEKSEEPEAESGVPEAVAAAATITDTPAQDEAASTAKKSKKSTAKESGSE